MLATLIDSIPGTISFGMLGASIEGSFATQIVMLDPLSLLISAGMFAVSFGLYRIVRRHDISF